LNNYNNQTLNIQADAIYITKNNKQIARLPLTFSVGKNLYTVVGVNESDGKIIGRTEDPKIYVEISFTDTGISVELKGSFSDVDSVVYFCNSEVFCQYGRAFVPDAGCRIFETIGEEDFYLTNSGILLQNQIGKDALDLWMLAPPPHVFSFGDNELGWWGISIPEVMPVVYTKISCRNKLFNISFHDYSSKSNFGRMPRIFIDVDLENSKDILDKHACHASELGLIDKNKKSYSWWHNPVYCTWGDQCYLQKTAPKNLEDISSIPLNEEMIIRWADGIRSMYSGEVNYIVDAGWFDYLGDYDPKLSEFESIEEFKSVLVKLKEKNFRTILWYTPFWVHSLSKVFKEHPEYLICRRDGTIYYDTDKRAFLDFSNPEVRNYAKTRIEYMLTILDADGFKIDMNYTMPFMSDIVLHDDSWGHGNDFWLNVLKFFHSSATAIKEDAFLTISGIESYLQPYASSVRLNDLFDMDNPTAWYNRAEMVARLMPDVPIDVDGWPSSISKMREYQFVSPVFGAPVAYYIEAVEVMSVKLTEVEHNRMASVWQVYGKVPCESGMQLNIDADNDVFERRDVNGNLQAVALQKSVLACYATDKIYLTANRDCAVSFPVNQGDVYENAEKVYRDGRRETVNLFRDDNSFLLNMSDSGNGILYYIVS
jgi:hypothetical protein